MRLVEFTSAYHGNVPVLINPDYVMRVSPRWKTEHIDGSSRSVPDPTQSNIELAVPTGEVASVFEEPVMGSLAEVKAKLEGSAS